MDVFTPILVSLFGGLLIGLMTEPRAGLLGAAVISMALVAHFILGRRRATAPAGPSGDDFADTPSDWVAPPPSVVAADPWPSSLPALCDILNRQARNVIEDTDVASVSFVAQLTRIEALVLSLNQHSANALTGMSEIDTLAANHEAESATLDVSIDQALASGQNVSSALNTAQNALVEVADTVQDLKSEMGEIDKIAKAINILAINASIEATRAGDAGAGFTVIAKEIRNLAGSTQDLTARLSPLIGRAGQVLTEFTDNQRGMTGSQDETSVAQELAMQRAALEGARHAVRKLAEDYGHLIEAKRLNLSESVNTGAKVQNEIIAALAAVQFQDVVRQQLESIITSLDNLAQISQHDDTGGITNEIRGLIDDMAKRYVMKSQREAHSGPGEAMGSDDIDGDRVEFF